MHIDRDEIIHLTEQYGGAWGINHTRRLLQLIEAIGEGQSYNADAVWLAAHLHDWGGYTPWKQDGVDHAERSRQVAAEFLQERECPEALAALVLECIATHHSADPKRPIEAILLSEADALDFLGAVGVLRTFSMIPRDLRSAYETAKKRRATLPGDLLLERSRAIAAERLPSMDAVLAAFEAQTFGCF